MSIQLEHAIKIQATPEQIYQALTTIDGLAAWHYGQISGEVAVGKEMYLNADRDLRFGWKTTEMELNRHIQQICVQGPGNSIGKQLEFVITADDPQTTKVFLTHGPWEVGDDHLPYCNTHWGGVLYRLKVYVESNA